MPLRDHEDGLVLRHYTYYRPTILVLLKEHESHGYELVSRMTELGFDQRLASSIYKVLRDMEDEGLIASSWDVSGQGGPPRRVYELTDMGAEFLRDAVPMLVRQRHALDAMLGLYNRLEDTGATPQPVSETTALTVRIPLKEGSTTARPDLRIHSDDHPRPYRPRRSASG
ncbi:MAG: helix-turn-helix transcriptional regulator [Actinomycetota bacterium]|nr:helix-turn-helix transcriptional regulator [Actinomycetota bacterium]